MNGIIFCGFTFAVVLSMNVPDVQSLDEPKCRVWDRTNAQYLPPNIFSFFSCAKCYHHMDKTTFENGTKLRQQGVWLVNPSTGVRYLANYSDFQSHIYKTFANEKLADLWISCCRAAESCCKQMTLTPHHPDAGSVCPRTWDGWNCWPDTPAGQVQTAPCPRYIYFRIEPSCTHYATKTCWDNATWYKNPRGNEYTDYLACGQEKCIKILLKTHVGTFGLSIALLIPAVGIFFYYRQLKVPRIFMHKNLFIALLLNSVFVVIFESCYLIPSVDGRNRLASNTPGCKIFYALIKYLRLSTYMWMLCEGFYLHKLIAAAFAEQKSMMVFHLVGWGVPVIPVAIWALVRQFKANEMCWSVAGDYEWILLTPMLVALVANFCFLAHIIQIIITKLRSSQVDEPAQFRRAVKATMVLVPLFGLHFLLFSYHPSKGNCHALLVHKISMYVMDGLQGGLVSLLFCYMNNEVSYLIRRSYERRKTEREILSQSGLRKPRDSRTSVTTHVESIANEGFLAKTWKK